MGHEIGRGEDHKTTFRAETDPQNVDSIANIGERRRSVDMSSMRLTRY